MLLLLLVAGVLCVSVHCMLQANLAVQEGRLSVAMGELRVAQAQLDDKQRELDEVQAMYDAAMKEKQTLLDNAETCRRKMQAASALINGLGGEKERWTAQSKEFQSQIGRYCTCAVTACHTGPQHGMLLVLLFFLLPCVSMQWSTDCLPHHSHTL